MIIIDEKSQPMRDVPPPYEDRQPPPFPISTRPSPTLDTLSPHLLLQIVHELFPQSSDASKGKAERRRVVLLYLSSSLRLVNKVFYVGKRPLLLRTHPDPESLQDISVHARTAVHVPARLQLPDQTTLHHRPLSAHPSHNV